MDTLYSQTRAAPSSVPRCPQLLPPNPQALTASIWSRCSRQPARPRLAGASSRQKGWRVIRNSSSSLIASSSPKPGGWCYSEPPLLPDA